MSTESTPESLTFVDYSTDSPFGVLTDARRRYVLTYLHETESATPRSELADAVAAWERRRDGETTEISRESVAISLHHSHLPKLEQAGLTEQTADGVSLTERGLSALERFSIASQDSIDESSGA